MFGRDKSKGDVAVLPPPARGSTPMPVEAAGPAEPEAPPTESLLGPNLSVKGEISFEDALRIEGEIQGKVTGQGQLTVGEGGRILGDITAAGIVIRGRVQGNVTAADRLEITSTAQVVGDIRATRLVVAEGARLMGRIEIASDSLTMPPVRAREGNGTPAPVDALEKVF
jgi:cytoskeletal protein CcmA (bactofilin family)